MKKNKKQNEIRQLTPEELAEEERKYNACKTPVKIGWAIYGLAAILYIVNGLFTQAQVNLIDKTPLANDLKEYKESSEYNDFITEAQKDAISRLEKGEITVDEYKFIKQTLSSDEKFEEFLRTLESDEYVQNMILAHEENAEKLEKLGKTYAGTSIASLSSLMVGTIILAIYRGREMDIEEQRKKREEQKNIESQMQ